MGPPYLQVLYLQIQPTADGSISGLRDLKYPWILISSEIPETDTLQRNAYALLCLGLLG